MEETNYLEFRKFNTREQAIDMADILSQNDITSVLNELPGIAYILSSNPAKEYRIKLLPQDFEKANALLLSQSAVGLEEVDKSYYLNRFTDEELTEIITKADEWNKYDFTYALKILKDRGKEVSASQLSQIQNQRLTDLAKPETVAMPYIVVGYLIALLGGLFAMFGGWHLVTHKKTLPNGKRVKSYSSSSRTHGMIMLVTGIVCFFGWVTLLILTKLL